MALLTMRIVAGLENAKMATPPAEAGLAPT
jgi:hypothetical protein